MDFDLLKMCSKPLREGISRQRVFKKDSNHQKVLLYERRFNSRGDIIYFKDENGEEYYIDYDYDDSDE